MKYFNVKIFDRLISQANVFEYAVNYSSARFKLVLNLIAKEVPSSDVMMFYYCSTCDAIKARKSGVPSLDKFNGVPLTLRPPHSTRKNDFDVFGCDVSTRMFSNKQQKFPNEEVLVLSLPRRFIDPLPGFESDSGLWVLSAEILKALRPASFVRVADKNPWLDALVLLPPQCILQSFVILENAERSNSLNESSEVTHDDDSDLSIRVPSRVISGNSSITSSSSYTPIGLRDVGRNSDSSGTSGTSTTPLDEIDVLNSIEDLTLKMAVIRQRARERGLVPLYHYTSHTAARLIRRNGFRMSSLSSKGDNIVSGGVYFTTQGPACYGLGSENYELSVSKDLFGNGGSGSTRRSLNAVIVYGCCARALENVVHRILWSLLFIVYYSSVGISPFSFELVSTS
jgi:hypothetical protein